MQKHTKRLFALLLAAVMVVGLLPVSALAARVEEDVAMAVPLGEEVVSSSLLERPATPLDADPPAQLAAADSLTIQGYTRVTELPDDGLEEGYYLFVVHYVTSNSDYYYMLYPGATGGGSGVNNAARLVVDDNGAATGYQVGAGTSYNSATPSDDFAAADNLVAPRNESNANGALYSATAVGPNGAAYYLCKKGTSGGSGAIYQTDCESAFTIHPLTGNNAGYFYLKHEQNSFVLFYSNNMNFDQLGSIGSHGGNFMLFKNDNKEPPLPTAQLQALITEAQGLTQSDYTPKTWATLQTALDAALSAKDSGSYKTMKAAITTLAAAKNGLQHNPTVLKPVTYTYPEATAETFEEGFYTVLGQGTGRTVILNNSGDRTDQNQKGPSNDNQLVPDGDAQLWRITKTSDGGYTIQGVSNNKYITSANGTNNQRALSTSPETFSITRTTGNTYEIKNSAGQYFSFLTNNHWGMSTSGTVNLYKQTEVPLPAENIKTAAELRPAGDTTTGQPFPSENGGLAGGDFYRIPTIVTVKGHTDSSLNGTLVAAADMRWKAYNDAKNIDTIVSYSTDNGETWHYSFVNFFGDSEQTASASKSAIFIDPLLTADNSGNLYLLVNAMPAGCANAGGPYQSPECTTGFAEINGVQRMTVYTSPENSAQDDTNYSYYIGDFATLAGDTSGTKYAPILDAFNDSESGFYTDDLFNLYQQTGTAKVPAADMIYCEQLNASSNNNGVWVQQNLFFYNATLHVRNAQFLYLVKSTDGGRTWGTPMILNDQVRTGAHQFYGPGPGAGICLEDGTIILPTYQFDEHSSFIYSNDGGETWTRGPILGWTSTENMIVPIDSNTIRQFYRNRDHNLYYADYTRADGEWTAATEPVFTGQQKQANNQISALRYAEQIDGMDIIVVSTSSDTAQGGGSFVRRGGKLLAFSLNEDHTMTYLSTYQINEVPAWYGYSTLTQLDNGSIGIIYENSQTDGGDINSPGYCGLTYFSISPYAILLPGLVARAGALKQADYTAETWSGLAAPLATAKEVKAGTNTTTGFQKAYEDLAVALKALRKVPVTISGTVTAGGSSVAGATVTLEDDEYNPVGLTVTTESDGQFTFDNNNTADVTLSATASYKLKVQGPGFTYKVTTVNANAFTDSVSADNDVTLEPQPAATYTNDFNTGNITMLQGATGDAAVATLTVVDHNGSKAVKISGLTGWDTPMHILDKNAHKLRNGVVSMDITPLTNDSHRFGLGLRADGAGKRVWVGHFESNSTVWNYQSYPDGNLGSFNSGTPLLMTQNATRHVEVEMTGTTLKLWVDGVYAGERTNNIRNEAGYVGISTIRSYAQFIIDNIYVRRTDPHSAVTLTAADGALTAQVIADDVTSALPGDTLVYEEDTVVITGTPTDATTHALEAVTVAKTGDTSTTVPVTKNADGTYQFTMPAYPVTVTGKFLPKVTGVTISGTLKQGQELTANVVPDGAEDKVTYQWQHKDASGWVNCTDANSTAKKKTLTGTDYDKQVRVIVTGNGTDYASTVSVTSDPTAVVGPADVETSKVTITRDNITMWKGISDPDPNNNTVMGNTVQLTAAVEPPNATNKTVTWTSNNTSVVTVSATGLVTAVGSGTTTVKAAVISANGTEVSDTVNITVKTGITSITLTQDGTPVTNGSVLTIYANASDRLDPDEANSTTVDAAVNTGADASGLVWRCGHTGEGAHIFQVGDASDVSSGKGSSVTISTSPSHTLVGEGTVTVSAPADSVAPGTTAPSVTFKVKVVHKLDSIDHSVAVTGYTGVPKVDNVLSASHSNLTQGFDVGALSYEWIRTKGTETKTVGRDATYKLTADDVGGTIKVKFTATPADGFYYKGTLTSAATDPVEKADGPGAPTGLTVTHCTNDENNNGTIGNLLPNTEYDLLQGTPEGDFGDFSSTKKTTDANGVISGLVPGNYRVRVSATTTHNAGSASTTITIQAKGANNKLIEIDSTIQNGVVRTTLGAYDPGVSVTVTVTPNTGYQFKTGTLKVTRKSDSTEVGVTSAGSEDGMLKFTFTMPNDDVTITAQFEPIKITITHDLTNVKCGEGHTGSETHEVDYGSHTTIELTPVDGTYVLNTDSIKVTQTSNSTALGTDYVTISGGTLTFANGVTQNITITATASKQTYTANFDPATGGYLTRAFTTALPVEHDATLTAKLTAATGYSVPAKADVTVTMGGTAVEFGYTIDGQVATITVANVTGIVSIAANSAVKDTIPITAAAIGGTPTEGNTLSITGVAPSGAAYTVTWQKANTQNGAYTDVAATDTYQLTRDDVGKYFKAVVKGKDDYSGEVTTTAVGPVVAKVVPATGVTIAAPEGSDNTVTMGSTLRLTASTLPADTTEKTVKWSVLEGSDVASVSADGVVTPLKAGSVTIQAQVIKATDAEGAASGVANSITITVITIPVTSVSVNGTARVGEKLTATVSPAAATVSYTWEKVNAETGAVVETLASTTKEYTLVATDENFKIKVTATGTGNYGGSPSAITEDAVVGKDVVLPTYAISITGGVANGSVTANKTEASSGQKIDLTVTPAAGYELSSLTVTTDEDGTEITVTNNAFFTMPGKAVTVTATFRKIVVTGVTLPSVGSVKVGSTTQLTATLLPAGATGTLEWSSSDPAVATVDTNGKVTGVAEGTATITVTVEGTSFTADCLVTVSKKTASSSSSGSTTTETKPDGTKVTTETKPDGTKVETVEEPDGTKSVTETKTDGTTTATVEEPDGTTSVTETKPDGSKTATVEQPEGTVSTTVTAPDGTASITVTDPDGEELVKAEIPATITVPETRFEDVSVGHWADEAIHKLAAIEVVNGTGGNKYSPTAPMTRGQLATVLHRFSNGKTDYKTAFKDVDSNKYYAEGVAWAAKANVVKGISEDRYAPDRVITREQLATMLCRYAKLIGMSTKADTKSLDAFVDGEKTGSWAVDSMAWCVENGILKGKGNNVLDPNSDVTRAEVAVMLDRFIALIQK